MIELDEPEYEAVESGVATMIVDRLLTVEVRQAEGLLTLERRVACIEALSTVVGNQLGITIGGGPPVRVQLAREKEASDG